MKKNEIKITYDPSQDLDIILSKPDNYTNPTTMEEHQKIYRDDLDTVIRGLSVLILVGETNGFDSIDNLINNTKNRIDEIVFDANNLGMVVPNKNKSKNGEG